MKIKFCPFHGLKLKKGPLGRECPNKFCDVAWAKRSVYGYDRSGRPADRIVIEGLCLGGG